MTEIMPQAMGSGSLVLGRMSVPELRAELAATLEITARHLVHLADVWRELERRGEDLSDLRSGLWSYMAMIAREELRAELVVRYAGYTSLLKRVARLPLHDQDRLIRDDKVVLVEATRDGVVERTLPLVRIKGPDLPRVLSDRIVDADEQRRALRKRPADTPVTRESADPIVQAALSRRSALRGAAKVHHQIGVTLAPDELSALKANAERLGLPLAKLIVGALVTTGLLEWKEQ